MDALLRKESTDAVSLIKEVGSPFFRRFFFFSSSSWLLVVLSVVQRATPATVVQCGALFFAFS